jgi:hypothetical protein
MDVGMTFLYDLHCPVYLTRSPRNTDIKKPDTGALHLERPHPSSHTPTTASRSPPEPLTPYHELAEPAFGSYTEPVSEGEEDEQMDLAPARDGDEARHVRLESHQVSEAVKFREEVLRKQEAIEAKDKKKGKAENGAIDEDGGVEADVRVPYLRSTSSAVPAAGRPNNLSIYPLAPASQFDKTFWSKLKASGGASVDEQDGSQSRVSKNKLGKHVKYASIAEQLEPPSLEDREDDGDEEATVFVHDIRHEGGKRISVPVRIEPKVIFANERTFLVSDPVFPS